MSDSSAVVECHGLTKLFRDFWLRARVTAVDQLDLRLESGEVLGLLGPNGSGKSTTIKMILGLLFPSRGRVEVFGEPPTRVPTKQRIGYLPEETHLYPFLDARETLDFYGRLFGYDRAERRRRSDELIEMVGLQDAQRRPVGEYSKGMQRRIGLAQALINDPDLLILDEPTSGLDPIGTGQVKELLGQLGDRGKTLLLCSHLLADVEAVCSRIVILYGGRILTQGTVEELLTLSNETLLRFESLAPSTVEGISALVQAAEGKSMVERSSPRQRLETLFLDLIEEARSRGQQTSGAGAGGRLAGFLGGRPTESR